MAGPLLSQQDRQQVAEAIRAAERRTSGEIYCVLARASDDYFFPSAFVVACGVVAVGLPVVWVLRHLWFDIDPVLLVVAQLAALGACIGLLRVYPALRIHLVPARLRYRRAHDNAVRQFLAHNIHLTRQRTGVLIFVSLAERYAEIVADAGIAARVPQSRWDAIVAALLEEARAGRLAGGFCGAVAAAGSLLEADFPAAADDGNEIGDHLVEL